MAPNKSVAERERARKHELEVLQILEKNKTNRFYAKMAGVCLVAYVCSGAVSALAGKTTSAHILFGLFTNFELKETLRFSVTAGALLGWWNTHRLRKKSIARLAPKAAAWELSLDPDRTSSKLLLTGETNPTDE